MNDEEWGPWIEHDGKHMPDDGAWCQATFDDCSTLSGRIDASDETHLDAFFWRKPEDVASHVIRYRIRHSRTQAAVEALKAIAADPKRKFRKLVKA